MKKILLTNSKVVATINHTGAELSSFLLDKKEYIWQANPAVWNRHAPVLFPTVGRLKEDTYFVNGKPFHLTQHGFARDSEFKLVSQNESSVTLELESNEQTLKVYPFDFKLSISYTLIESTLEVKYQIENPSQENLLFSIGGHPAFNCPLDPMKEAFEDYEINFHENSSEKEIYLLDGLFLSQSKGKISCPNGKLILSYDLFKNDAIIIDSEMPFKVSVISKKSNAGFSMEYGDFRWLGIWTKQAGAGFLCLEPWNGIADTTDHDQDFEKKLGINTLPPGEKYEAKYIMEFY